MAGDAVTLTVPGPDGDREVRISSPNRVLWPELGITKHELAEYLVAVGDAFVAANGDRPVSLERFPERHRRRAVLLEEPAEGRTRVRRARSRSPTPAGGGIRSSSSTSPPRRSGRCR